MDSKNQLKKRIAQTELQIKKLNLHSSKSEVCEDLYNSLILQKAVMKKQLADMDKNVVVEKIKSFFPKKEKLICDYFN